MTDPAEFGDAVEATEEAVLNALFRATTTTGHRGTIEAVPVARIRALVRGEE